MTHLLMVEDDVQLCRVVGLYMKDLEYAIDFIHDGDTGLYAAQNNSYDLIILDRMLPNMAGLEIVKHLRATNIETPILILTALDQLNDRVDGLDAGADDYLTKPFQIEELLARIRALLRRKPKLEMQTYVLKISDVCLNVTQRILVGNNGSCTLSNKESDLLEMFFRQPSNILTRELLFNHVWGVTSDVDESNLDCYIRFLRRRLATVTSKVQIQTIRSVGYSIEII